MVIKLATIRISKIDDIDQISKIMIPAFQDKVSIIVGDDKKAEKIIKEIIKSIKGKIYVAIENEKIVGAIIISTSLLKISSSTSKTCFKELGFIKSIKAFNLVKNYLKSVPQKNDDEGTLEAVGVLNAYHGKGVGKDLIIYSENYLRENNYKYFGLGVKNDNLAVNLYKKLDFEIITMYSNKLGDWYYMRKNI